MYFCPYETMVKLPCSVISESWKSSKLLLVTITKVAMKLHNVQIKSIILNLKVIYPKTECMGSVRQEWVDTRTFADLKSTHRLQPLPQYM